MSDPVRDFVDWLYDLGPDPNAVTRERLLQEYETWFVGREVNREEVRRWLEGDGRVFRGDGES